MASVFSHAVAAAALGAALYRPEWRARGWALGAACAITPDADVIRLPLSVPFGSLLGAVFSAWGLRVRESELIWIGHVRRRRRDRAKE